MSAKDNILIRVYMAFFMLVLCGLAVMFQAFRIQVVQGDTWRSMADSLSTEFRTIEAKRGNVYTETGRLLATSLPYFEIGMDPNVEALTDDVFDAHVDSLALMLSQQFGDRSPAAYRNLLVTARRTGKRYVRLQGKIGFNDLQAVKTFPLFREGKYGGGLIINESKQRHYPYGILAHRTIGYVREGPGSFSVGIEQAFDPVLRGVDGKQLMQKIAGATWKPINSDADIEARNGRDVITTIDIEIQDAAEDALERTLRAHNARHGCVIVMEVATGKIRAIANLGLQADSTYFETYNYAIGEATEPGSTFKTATLMALLEDGLIELTDTVDITGGQVRYGSAVMKDSEWHPYRKVSVAKAFEISSNVGISKVARKHYGSDPSRFIARLRAFGLDRKTGIEIRGEAEPFISSPDYDGWSRLSVPWISVGYEVKLAPLHVLAFYNAIANGGTLMKPYLISAIEEYGKTQETFEPTVLSGQICSQETVEALTRLMVGVVDSGTARSIHSAHFEIAGKTGTAQIADANRGYQKVYQSSFAGFFPANNPTYSCIVVVNSPRNGVYYGGSVAAPVFREIADKIYTSNPSLFETVVDSTDEQAQPLEVKGDLEDILTLAGTLGLHTDYADGVNTGEHTLVRWTVTGDSSQLAPVKPGSPRTVPDVRGMGLRDALPLLEHAGLKVEVQGVGKVRQQTLVPGQSCQKGQVITLILG